MGWEFRHASEETSFRVTLKRQQYKYLLINMFCSVYVVQCLQTIVTEHINKSNSNAHAIDFLEFWMLIAFISFSLWFLLS